MLINIKEIDEGNTAKVYRADLQCGGLTIPVAIKVSHGKITSNQDLNKEIELLSRLIHPNIIGILHQQTQFEFPSMVMEFADNGALDYYLLDMNGTWRHNEATRTQIALGIACGLEYLHAKKLLLHNDLKPANILLDKNLTPKISDFGFAIKINRRFDTVMTRKRGTPLWMAPEILDAPNSYHCGYNESSDIYSFALTLWMLYSLSSPYDRILKQFANVGIRFKEAQEIDFIRAMIIGGVYEDAQVITSAPVRRLVLKAFSLTPSYRPRIEAFVQALETTATPSLQ